MMEQSRRLTSRQVLKNDQSQGIIAGILRETIPQLPIVSTEPEFYIKINQNTRYALIPAKTDRPSNRKESKASFVPAN